MSGKHARVRRPFASAQSRRLLLLCMLNAEARHVRRLLNSPEATGYGLTLPEATSCGLTLP